MFINKGLGFGTKILSWFWNQMLCLCEQNIAKSVWCQALSHSTVGVCDQ